MSDPLSGMSQEQAALVRDQVGALAEVSGIQAVVLAGSFARGRARTDSDIDLGLLYSDEQAPDLEMIRGLAARWHDSPRPVVTELYEWGPWVNGGAWLTVSGQRVDWLYRNLEQLERVIEEADAGRFEDHYLQQAPYGFLSVNYQADLLACRVLHDPLGRIARLKLRVLNYPEPLRASIVRQRLRDVEFGIESFARPAAARADVYYSVGCLTRCAAFLVQALFALNRVYQSDQKTALDEIEEFDHQPADFRRRIDDLLANPGADAEHLSRSVRSLEALFRETASLSGDLYQSGAA
ncbi:MAG: DUF4037 domain-containing protein [bacterium]|nr:DUF4037 domain-containing protein [bacterium]